MPVLEVQSRVAWPSVIFDAPIFRGLDQRAQKEIEAAGTLRKLHGGDAVFREHESGDAFFVVASGAVVISAVRRGDDAATVIRRVSPGEPFGEEAVVSGARQADAIAEGPTVVAGIPVHLFRRAVGRSKGADQADRLERALRRSATRDLLRTVAVARDLDEASFDMLLDAVAYRSAERGEAIYRAGDASEAFFIVADGMVQIQTEDEARLRVRAYVSRGDFFGDEELEDQRPRSSSAVASGRVTLLEVPRAVARQIAQRSPELFARLRRMAEGERERQRAIVGGAALNATAHVFRDLYRLEVARSLLVIDLESCVRCGHCTWACGDLYGTPRLVRRGDKIVSRREVQSSTHLGTQLDVFSGALEGADHLMLPNSCQHCENPACMVDCPTGAIGKDPEGEVFIREELCTGCGACARACPWSNIQMAERPKATARPPSATASELAVKCNLCRDFDAGPACVQACPTGAIFRISPTEDLAELRGLFQRGPSREITGPSRFERVAPSLAGALAASIAIGGVGALMQSRKAWSPTHGLGYAAGVAAAVGFAFLLSFVLVKRGVRLWIRRPVRRPSDGEAVRARSITAPALVVHVVLGLVSTAFAVAHAPFPPTLRGTSGGALYLSFVIASMTGILTAIAYAWIPQRLSRIERTALLPEDFAQEKQALSDRLFRGVTGRSEVVKKLVERILLPYAKSRVGPLLLLFSGRDLRAERVALRTRVDGVLSGRGQERLAGIDDLVRVVVELRALPAQRLLTMLLRVGLPLHVGAFAIASVLLVLHLVAGVGR